MWQEDENKKSNINNCTKKGGPQKRPTKLEAAAINVTTSHGT